MIEVDDHQQEEEEEEGEKRPAIEDDPRRISLDCLPPNKGCNLRASLVAHQRSP